MDMISNLPDDIICHIGSFLSAKEAAFTTLLSKRWQNLIKIIQDLHIHVSKTNGESLKDFADRLSSLPASSRIKKLEWWFIKMKSDQYDHINTCLRDVLKRGVLDLDLWVNCEEEYSYSLPFEVFTCKTVVKLSLGFRFSIDMLPKNALLPSLKILSLNYVKFYEFGGCCAFKTLLDASPVLEELTLEHWKWSRSLSSLRLKRLTIIRKDWDDYDESDFESIIFDTPSLVYLYYSDYVPKEYLDVNLNSLVEATLDLKPYPRENFLWIPQDAIRFNLTNLLHGLKNVEILNLDSAQTSEMFYAFREALPVFEKLSHLSVRISSNLCWFPLKVLVKKSPNLKTLTIKGALHYRDLSSLYHCVSTYSFLVSCPLEVLKITEYYGTQEELTYMEYILGNLSCLELVVVCKSFGRSERKVRKLRSILQKLPRASSNCKIQVVG